MKEHSLRARGWGTNSCSYSCSYSYFSDCSGKTDYEYEYRPEDRTECAYEEKKVPEVRYTHPTMKIAIVGSGIAGLTCAHYLAREHELTVFESGDHIGGHTHTHDIELDGRHYAIDTGFIVLNDRTYPNFRRLLDELGVATQPTTMSFSVSCQRTGLEYRGADLNGLFAQRRNLLRPRFLGLLADLMRFNKLAEHSLASAGDEVTAEQFFREHRFGEAFREQYFFPMASAIWSCPRATVGQFPMRFIVSFYRHHGLLGVRDRPQWHVVRGGSKRYVEALVEPIRDCFRLKMPVTRVIRHADSVEVTAGGRNERFDHLVLACPSDQALRILGDGATLLERELLGAFGWQENLAMLHTDVSVLPRQRRAWAAWNYHLAAGDQQYATLTYDMNLLQGIGSPNRFCVSLNCPERIDRRKVLREMVYHHPVFTVRRAGAQARHAELIGPNRTSFCGAWWGNGFHEDGVVSALRVVEWVRRQDPRQIREPTKRLEPVSA